MIEFFEKNISLEKYILHILHTIIRHSRFGHCEMSLKISGTYLPSLNNYEIFSILKKAEPKYEFLHSLGKTYHLVK